MSDCEIRKLTEEEIADLKSKAKIVLAEKTRYYKKIIGVEPIGVKITSATTRWGSCSGTNSICYSYRVMLLSNRAQDYIVVHELCHILQKNHSPKFYREVAKILPDYKDRIKEIKNFSNFGRQGKIHKKVTNFLCNPIDKFRRRGYTVEN